MFRRKLLALDYYRAEGLDINKNDDFRSLVIWTEDQKIRHYKIEQRGPLRDLDNPQWEVAFDAYWNDVGFPISWKEMERTQVRTRRVIWIAIELRVEISVFSCSFPWFPSTPRGALGFLPPSYPGCCISIFLFHCF